MKKRLTGKVVSVGMEKTVVVEVSNTKPHPMYKKLLKRSKRMKADCGSFTPKIEETVVIEETRPISKSKFFKVVEVLA